MRGCHPYDERLRPASTRRTGVLSCAAGRQGARQLGRAGVDESNRQPDACVRALTGLLPESSGERDTTGAVIDERDAVLEQ
jgi:hypothetical protein